MNHLLHHLKDQIDECGRSLEEAQRVQEENKFLRSKLDDAIKLLSRYIYHARESKTTDNDLFRRACKATGESP